MEEYSLAHDYLTKLTRIISDENDTRDLALVYYYQGLNFYREGNYTQSMIEYEKALAIQRKLFSEGHSDLGETLRGIGVIYDNVGKYELALEKHLECLAISEKMLSKDHVHIAEAVNNIDVCYDRMGKFEWALEYDIRALEMKQHLFPYDHPDQPLDYHQQASAMKERCLPSNHSELAVSYCNISRTHLARKHYDEAIIYYTQIDQNGLVYGLFINGQVYRAKEKESQLALKHFQKAIDIYAKSLPRKHPYIGLSLMYIGDILCDQDDVQNA
ncbi:unnamed protein product [Rotaria socialis]|uniref:Kinesin light chain n=1 Tax=Rotaria socialis TaxID=392032 RepID=A0A820RHX9_9BILA|nr:unnamed protein product [Rotaria socialis]